MVRWLVKSLGDVSILTVSRGTETERRTIYQWIRSWMKWWPQTKLDRILIWYAASIFSLYANSRVVRFSVSDRVHCSFLAVCRAVFYLILIFIS